MSIIDWSDPEEMLGLLAEYIRDELREEHFDRRRVVFLGALASAVESVISRGPAETRSVLTDLRTILERQPSEFHQDPVLAHVSDCIEELARIKHEQCE